jgi:hypothetical protein
MEVARSSDSFVNIYQTTRRRIPEASNLSHRRENLLAHM